MNVIVASRNPVKLRAVHDAFADWFPGKTFDVHSVDPPSSIPEQPIGGDVARGAMARAEEAIGSPDTDWGVGVEAGLVRLRGCECWANVQICAIADRAGRVSHGFGSGFELPEDLRMAVLSGRPLRDALREFRRTEDDDRAGAIHVLSGGRIDRYEITVAAVRMALVSATQD